MTDDELRRTGCDMPRACRALGIARAAFRGRLVKRMGPA